MSKEYTVEIPVQFTFVVHPAEPDVGIPRNYYELIHSDDYHALQYLDETWRDLVDELEIAIGEEDDKRTPESDPYMDGG